MLQPILEPIFAALFFGIGYLFGFFPVLFGSLGSIEPGPIDRVQDNSFYRAKGMRWWHMTYVEGNNRIMPAEGVACVGWLLLGILVAVVWLVGKIAV